MGFVAWRLNPTYGLNIDTRSADDLPLRQSIVRAALTTKGILPAP